MTSLAALLLLLLMHQLATAIDDTSIDSLETGNSNNHNNISAGTSSPLPETLQTLFFTSPGGATSFTARDGLYGVTVDYRKQTDDQLTVASLLPVSFNCIAFNYNRDDIVIIDDDDTSDHFRSTNGRALRVRSMSYDPISGYVLMDVVSRDDYSLTLVRGRPCETPTEAASAVRVSTAANCSHASTIGGEDRSTNWTTSSGSTTAFYGNIEVLFYNAKVVDNVKVGPFAYHDSRIFFVLQRFERPDYRTKINIIEIRQMSTSCADGSPLDVPVTATNSAFDVVDCSTVVANVTSEEYESVHAYRPLNTLIVVRRDMKRWASSDDSRRAGHAVRPVFDAAVSLDFYFQLQRLKSITDQWVNISVVLYHASMPSRLDSSAVEPLNPPADQGPPRWPRIKKFQTAVDDEAGRRHGVDGPSESWAEPVHEQAVGSGHLKYVLVQLGGVDHRRSTLCWAAVDRVLCGRRSDETGRVDDIVTAVDEGQAAAVCHAPDNSAALRHVITGVAMSYAVEDREVALYFGCAAQIGLDDIGLGGLIGGAGLVRLPAYGVWPARITPLRLGAETIRAGAMFVVDRCADFSAWNVEDTASNGWRPEAVWRRKTASSVVWLSSAAAVVAAGVRRIWRE